MAAFAKRKAGRGAITFLGGRLAWPWSLAPVRVELVVQAPFEGVVVQAHASGARIRRMGLGYVELQFRSPFGFSGIVIRRDVVLLRRRISGVRILHLALTHWPRKDRAPPGRFFVPSPLRFIGARPACDGVGQANGKSLLLFPGPTIETEGLFLDVFHQDRAGAWWELRGPQHAFNDRC